MPCLRLFSTLLALLPKAQDPLVKMSDCFYVEPKPGDLIEISRLGYQHWAIYVGSGYVIHLTPSDDELKQSSLSSFSSVVPDKMVVKKALLWEVAGGDVCRVNNKYDRKHRPRPARKIVQEAELLLGMEMRYSLATSNCEHFATRLRYGMARSDQVKDTLIVSTMGVIGVGVAVVVATAIGLILEASRSGKD